MFKLLFQFFFFFFYEIRKISSYDKKHWFWPNNKKRRNVLGHTFFIFQISSKKKKKWNSILNHFQPLLFHTFPPVMNFIILVILLLTWYCWPVYILGFWHKMEDNLRFNKDLFPTKDICCKYLKVQNFAPFDMNQGSNR